MQLDGWNGTECRLFRKMLLKPTRLAHISPSQYSLVLNHTAKNTDSRQIT